MSGPDLLERTRMALAEAGYPNVTVRSYMGRPCVTAGAVPSEVMWKAISTVRGEGRSEQMCWACRLTVPDGTPLAGIDRITERCLADRPLVRDCGVAR